MQRVDPMIGVAAAALIVVATAACSTAPRTALEAAASVTGVPETATTAASYPPPPERAEIPPPASSPQALWRSGYWTWNGVKYVWMRGQSSARRPPQTGSPDIGSSGPKVGFGSKVNGSPEPDSTAIRSVLSTGVPAPGECEVDQQHQGRKS